MGHPQKNGSNRGSNAVRHQSKKKTERAFRIGLPHKNDSNRVPVSGRASVAVVGLTHLDVYVCILLWMSLLACSKKGQTLITPMYNYFSLFGPTSSIRTLFLMDQFYTSSITSSIQFYPVLSSGGSVFDLRNHAEPDSTPSIRPTWQP